MRPAQRIAVVTPSRLEHQNPDHPDDGEAPGPPAEKDHSNDWPDQTPHAPDEVREPPQPRRAPIEEPRKMA